MGQNPRWLIGSASKRTLAVAMVFLSMASSSGSGVSHIRKRTAGSGRVIARQLLDRTPGTPSGFLIFFHQRLWPRAELACAFCFLPSDSYNLPSKHCPAFWLLPFPRVTAIDS